MRPGDNMVGCDGEAEVEEVMEGDDDEVLAVVVNDKGERIDSSLESGVTGDEGDEAVKVVVIEVGEEKGDTGGGNDDVEC